MINLDSITNEKHKEHNEKWPYISDHPYRILIIGSSGSEKTNTLLHLIKEQDDIDKIYLYAKDLSEPSMNIGSRNLKMQEQNNLRIQMHLLSVEIQSITFLGILMNTIQAGKEKF